MITTAITQRDGFTGVGVGRRLAKVLRVACFDVGPAAVDAALDFLARKRGFDESAVFPIHPLVMLEQHYHVFLNII